MNRPTETIHPPLSDEELFEFLEQKYEEFNVPAYIDTDPIQVPHLFSRKEDIEIAAFLSASIAWGNRKAIVKSARIMMNLMDNAPFQFVTGAGESDLQKLSTFVHRTFNGYDFMFFVRSLVNIYDKNGGLESIFVDGLRDAGDMKQALVHVRDVMLQVPLRDGREKHIANAARNSSCKRLNMFLRWMVRDDGRGVDFGLWKSISPAALYIPLDVHAGNVARKLGLLHRRQDDWRAVEELTARLRRFCPSDPVKYDYSLFGLGVFEGF